MNNFSFSPSLKNKDLVTPDAYQNHQQQQQSSGLMRNRSAPSSFFATLLNQDNDGYLNNSHPCSPESNTMFIDESVLQYPSSMKHETMGNSYCGARDSLNKSSSIESSFSLMNANGGNCSNLVRQNSSPAGFLSYLTSENGFGGMRDVGNLCSNNSISVEPSPSTSRLSNNMSFSTGPSTNRFIPQIAENGNENIMGSSHANGQFSNSNDPNRCYLPSIPKDSWANSTFNGLKRNREGDLKMFSSSNEIDTQSGDPRQYTPGLVHHLSLPKTSTELAMVENYLQFQQDVVPFKTRAKRGFATHPRSIAERVRRTKISQRMKRLTELFPNMDKQANTADMLDLAVDYIKEIQKEVQTLKETLARCTCSIKEEKKSSPTI